METNHEDQKKLYPDAYKGEVARPGTAQASNETCSVAEAASYYNLPPILERYGDWVICNDGIFCLYVKYHIAKDRFHETDWVSHVTEKTWVNSPDFIAAFQRAQAMVKSGEI